MGHLRKPIVGLAVVLLAAAIGTAWALRDTGRPLETLSLPVRVHLIRSDDSAALDCTRDRPNVEALIAEANTYWRQAGIVWWIESMQPRPAQPAPDFDALLHTEATTEAEKRPLRESLRRQLAAAMPADGWLPDGLDLVLLDHFGAFGAGFYDGNGRVYLARYGIVEPEVVDELPAVILAHELGHALGLHHEPCNQRGNLMLGRCPSRDRHARKLTATQIRKARMNAEPYHRSPA